MNVVLVINAKIISYTTRIMTAAKVIIDDIPKVDITDSIVIILRMG